MTLTSASAMPSMMPNASAGAPKAPARNSGTTGYTISDATSVNRLTQPKVSTIRGSPKRDSLTRPSLTRPIFRIAPIVLMSVPRADSRAQSTMDYRPGL